MNILRYLKKYMSLYKRSVYQDYELQDFLTDEFFVSWVKKPTPETSHFWDKWIAQHPEKLPLILKSKQIIHAINYQNKYEISDQEYTEIYEAVVRSRSFKIFPLTRQDNTKWLLNIAAILLLVIGSVLIYSHYFPSQSVVVQPSVTWLEKSVPKGTKLTLTLPDGSHVKLNAGSTLKYPKSFAQDTVRRVYLTGEAFFEVAENKEKAFIVEGGEWQASVLGTSFMMRTHTEKPLVALLTGKLIVQHQKEVGSSVVLRPLEMATPSRSKGKLVISSFQPDELLAWKEGKIVFKNTSFREVVDILENWYGIQIQIEQGLFIPGNFSGIYDNETLENVLRGLVTTSSVKFQYKIQGKKVTLMPAPQS